MNFWNVFSQWIIRNFAYLFDLYIYIIDLLVFFKQARSIK